MWQLCLKIHLIDNFAKPKFDRIFLFNTCQHRLFCSIGGHIEFFFNVWQHAATYFALSHHSGAHDAKNKVVSHKIFSKNINHLHENIFLTFAVLLCYQLDLKKKFRLSKVKKNVYQKCETYPQFKTPKAFA